MYFTNYLQFSTEELNFREQGLSNYMYAPIFSSKCKELLILDKVLILACTQANRPLESYSNLSPQAQIFPSTGSVQHYPLCQNQKVP